MDRQFCTLSHCTCTSKKCSAISRVWFFSEVSSECLLNMHAVWVYMYMWIKNKNAVCVLNIHTSNDSNDKNQSRLFIVRKSFHLLLFVKFKVVLRGIGNSLQKKYLPLNLSQNLKFSKYSSWNSAWGRRESILIKNPKKINLACEENVYLTFWFQLVAKQCHRYSWEITIPSSIHSI